MAERDTVRAEDFLDDGTPIALAVHIDRRAGTAVFDFAGTGPEIYGNLNAPPAVTASAVIYCLRCLLPTSDIPLNQGVLTPVEIKIPPHSVLNPSSTAAVVGGNVQTSQRVTDVVLKVGYSALWLHAACGQKDNSLSAMSARSSLPPMHLPPMHLPAPTPRPAPPRPAPSLPGVQSVCRVPRVHEQPHVR
jgi:N-methylhydantoinase B/oxoprolinase/acetone carboxylase alpha subunit